MYSEKNYSKFKCDCPALLAPPDTPHFCKKHNIIENLRTLSGKDALYVIKL